MVVGVDAVRARSVQRSFSVRGAAEAAERRGRELVDDVGVSRVVLSGEGARLTFGDLLEALDGRPHLRKRATVVSRT